MDARVETAPATRSATDTAPEHELAREAVVVFGLAAATIAGAYAFQAAGYAPCELCLKERLPYYAGTALAAATAGVAARGSRTATSTCYAALAALFLLSAAFGAFHAGVEWGIWPGPSDCTGTLKSAGSTEDFLAQLRSMRVVRCDAVAIRILGLSLAGWNAVISLAIAGVATVGLRRAARRRP